MAERIQPLIEAAKQLTVEEREKLLEALLQLDGNFERDKSDVSEWLRRADEIRQGTADCVEADEAIADARAELKRQRSS